MSDEAGFEDWAEHVRTSLVPMITESAVTISLVPETTRKVDVKFAVELGLSIMLDKPIIAVVRPGTLVPAKLVMVADEIIEADMDKDAERVAGRIAAALKSIVDRDR